ncbi:hypothetical protein PG913_01705 [Tenacibaculum pacificus]|uniref:hypothetical protein n=1 Tax=Tenacibaculum pacificus TaxID=3018314 RepID=UPI0022F3FBFB|nr:hypothetical protein [Tenacibaculum pacificus]WBX73985.1 hypothetical protein PG913_01705 [Tenacibaculum pacificus]
MLASVAFVSCSDDDNNAEESVNSCKECEMMGSITTKYCDNGDGTITVTVLGQETSISRLPEGTTFDKYIESMDTAGVTCK